MAKTTDYRVNLPTDNVNWFHETHPRASLSWLLSNLLQSYKDLHVDESLDMRKVFRDSAVRTNDEHRPMQRRRAYDQPLGDPEE